MECCRSWCSRPPLRLVGASGQPTAAVTDDAPLQVDRSVATSPPPIPPTTVPVIRSHQRLTRWRGTTTSTGEAAGQDRLTVPLIDRVRVAGIREPAADRVRAVAPTSA